MSSKQVLSAPRCPWHRGYIERPIDSLRRECLDHIIVFGEYSLRCGLAWYVSYSTAGALICCSAKMPRNSDEHRPAPKLKMVEIREVGGLHHITNARPPK